MVTPESLQSLSTEINTAWRNDVSNEKQLGEMNNFREAESAKNEICSYLSDCVFELERSLSEVGEEFSKDFVAKIQEPLARVKGWISQIEKQIQAGQTDAQFSRLRDNLNNDARNLVGTFRQSLVRDKLLLKSLGDLSEKSLLITDEKVHAAGEILNQLENFDEEGHEIIERLRDRVGEKLLLEGQSSFTSLAANHHKREGLWLKGCAFAGFATILAIFYSAFESIIFARLGIPLEAGSIPTVVETVFRKAVILSAPLLFFRACMTKYNAERHLRILYSHRVAAIEQMDLFSSAFGDNERKTELLLEAAKMILTDPTSPYSDASDSSEININPVFSAAEKLAKS